MGKEISGGIKGRTYLEKIDVLGYPLIKKETAQLNKRVILEIGPGEGPFYIEGQRKLKNGEYYLGVDKNPYRCRWDLNSTITGNARRLPLRDESAKEIIICNVVGDPRVDDEVGEVVKEARRVLSPDGEIVVIETYSPIITPVERVEKLMQENGLELNNREFIHDKKQIDQYAISEGRMFAYIAKFSRL